MENKNKIHNKNFSNLFTTQIFNGNFILKFPHKNTQNLIQFCLKLSTKKNSPSSFDDITHKQRVRKHK